MALHSMNQTCLKHAKHLSRAILSIVLVLYMTLGLSACSKELLIAGKAVDRQATSLDLRKCGITDAESVQSLRKMRMLTKLDLRENSLVGTEIEAIQLLIPNCRIRWSVPLGSVLYDSDSETIVVPDFSQADLLLLGYFSHLVSLDASGSTDYAALIAAQEEYPDISINWTCAAAGKTFSSADQNIVCAKGTILEEVATLLAALPNVKIVDIRDTNILADNIVSLQGEYPSVQFLKMAYLINQRYDTAATALQLTAAESFDVIQFIDQLAFFPNLTELDLREVPVDEQSIAAIMERFPALNIRWSVPLFEGLRVDSSTESLDLRGYTISDLAALEQKLQWLKKLTYLDMCNCGPSDEEMAQLRNDMPQVKIVWMLHVGYWEIRTDTKAFSMGEEKEYGGVRYTKTGEESRRYRWADNEQVAKLRYCTDIEALDIGHAYLISDISFLRELPKLRFLVISMTETEDISPVSTLKNLIFFEMFEMKQIDISVLYDLPQLEYLNCSGTEIMDIKPLLSLTNLKRLWVIHCGFSGETLHSLKVGLPDAIVIANGKHSTDTGWRFDNPAYLEMQALFGLPPQLDWQTAEYLLPENQIP